MEAKIKTDVETRKTWAEVDRIVSRLRKLDAKLKKQNPQWHAYVVLVKGKEMWIGADHQFKSTQDMDDSIGIRMYEAFAEGYCPVDTKKGWDKGDKSPWTFVGFVTCENPGHGLGFYSDKKSDRKYADRAWKMLAKYIKESNELHARLQQIDLDEMKENYGSKDTNARYRYSRAVKRNPALAGKHGFPKYAHMKMKAVR
jgi:hypothetical protein